MAPFPQRVPIFRGHKSPVSVFKRVGSGLEFGDHDSFYSAREAGGTGLKGKNERLSRKSLNAPERLEVEED
jgi:hypothetical protein